MKIRYRTVLCVILAAAVAVSSGALPYPGRELLAEEEFFIVEETGEKDRENVTSDTADDPDGGPQQQDGEWILPGESGQDTNTPASPFDKEEPETLPSPEETEAETETESVTETDSFRNPGTEDAFSDPAAEEPGMGEEGSEETETELLEDAEETAAKLGK